MVQLGELKWCAPEHVGGVPKAGGRMGLKDLIPRYVPEYRNSYPIIEENQLREMEAETDRIYEVKDTGLIESLRHFIATEDVRGDMGTDMVMPMHCIRKVFYVDGVCLNYMDDDFFDRLGEEQAGRLEMLASNDNRTMLYCKRRKDGILMKTRDPVVHRWGERGWRVVYEKDNMDSVWYYKHQELESPTANLDCISHLLDS